MIALNYNILQDYDTIGMTNEDANYPIENIFSSILTLYAKTTAQGTVITITFTANRSADMFAMAFSNLSDASTIVCVYRDAGANILLTDNLTKGSYYIVRSYFAAKLTTIRSITITITNAVAAAFYFGTIWIGEKIALPDIEAKHRREYGDTIAINRSPTGQVAGQIGGLLKTFNFKFPLIATNAMIETIEDYINGIGKMPHFLDVFDEIDDNIHFCALTNERISSIFQNETGFMHRDIELIYKECL
jgi:hypothetical protein